MYTDFAEYYDMLTGDVDYAARTEYLCSLFEKFDRMPTLMLDLACGTGGFSNAFANKGVSVIGVDMSPEMLNKARDNSEKQGNDVLYLCQNACELDLFGTVDGVVCCLDSLNHIVDYNDFCKAIAKVSLFLEKDRLFIFDVNTLFKHESVLGDNIFVIDEDALYCVWSNSYDKETHTTEMLLDFFARCDDGCYERFTDEVTERAYTTAEIENALKEAGLCIEAVYAELTQEEVTENTERMVFVTRKV